MSEQGMRAGDAVHTIISKYSNMVYRLAYARTGNRMDADDIYQDVFLKLFSKGISFDNEEHMKAWLIRTTIHTSTNLFKSAWRRYAVATDRVADVPYHPADDERHERLGAALDTLPEKYRVTLFLFYYEQITTDRIAELIGVKPATVRSRLVRGRERLREKLEEKEAETDD